MLTLLLLSKKIRSTALVTLFAADLILGTILLAYPYAKKYILPEGVSFGFYKTTKTEG